MKTIGSPRVGWLVIATVAIGALSACDSLDELLKVEDTSRVIAQDLDRPSNAALLVRSAINDFDCAFSIYITVAGLVGEEYDSSTNLLSAVSYDRRDVDTSDQTYSSSTCDDIGSGFGFYTPLSTARWQADNALRLLESDSHAGVADRVALVATAAAYSGYSHLLIGEGMCTAAFDSGPELTQAEVFERAEDRFSTAIESAQQAGNTELLNLARVGRARTRLNLGRGSAAVEDARTVPLDFEFDVEYAATPLRVSNSVNESNDLLAITTVGPLYRDVTYKGVPDPRVPVEDAGKTGPNGGTPVFLQKKYPSASSPIPLATWEEAQLIIAEVQGGNEAVDIINTLHDRVDLPEFEGGDANAIREQLIYERRMELFLESQHLYDLTRLSLPLDPPAGTPYPGGGNYGNQSCLPLPDVERLNNPNIG